MDLIKQMLKVIDTSALSLSMDNNIPIIVFNLNQEGFLEDILAGEKIGTTIGG